MFAANQQELQQKITAAERAYAAQAGGASLCQLQKDGRMTGGVKYTEGQMVALTTARRLFDEAADEQGVLAALAVEQTNWRQALAAQQVRSRPAAAWVAYYQGGVDSLDWALESVRSTSA